MIRKKAKSLTPYTMLRCGSCGRDIKRPHSEGDYVCQESECPQCGYAAAICGIFGEESV